MRRGNSKHRNKTKRWRQNPLKLPRIVNAENPQVSVIVPVQNERRTIVSVLREACRVHPLTEVIVVSNGTSDGTDRIAQEIGAKVIVFSEPLGHDVGRAIGARAAKGDILLFVDGDFVVTAADLRPLVRAVEAGTDVALNAYLGPTNKKVVHNVVLAKHCLNQFIGRPDLRGASLTTVPHALSRKALEVVGPEQLSVPPKAMAIAVQGGLNVQAVHFIDVGSKNRRRNRNKGKNPLEQLIVGDHLEAIDWFIKHNGERGNRTDLMRQRELIR